MFRCSGHIERRPGGVPQCAHCLARWVRDEALNYDADLTLMATQPLNMVTQLVEASGFDVQGLKKLISQARLPENVASELRNELLTLGAVDVRELGLRDWTSLAVWCKLREMERRRVLDAAGMFSMLGGT